MKKSIIILSSFLISCITIAQVGNNKLSPKSFSKEITTDFESNKFEAPELNIQRFLAEDAVQAKDVAERFAAPIEVNLSIDNVGKWTILSNGDKLWQYKIESKGAHNINLQFNNFELPEESEFYVYSEDRKDVRGAFTSTNNRSDRTFAVYLIKGESAILEYYQPKNTIGVPKIELERILHGYKSPKSFGASGPCNNNVNCPVGADWLNEIKSSAMIITGGVGGARWCSGAMVNNVRQDATPYFLTADHCLTGTESGWAFIYNYESPNCTNIDGSLAESVLGATVVASDAPSDFALLLLDNAPPVSYDVYHSGWDANDVVKDSTVGIHYPSGDIKKISFDYDAVTSAGYNGGSSCIAGNDHWCVANWEDGTTEQSSSGSPLYDRSHRIIGQLHGGTASCSSITEDLYGKFSHSWNTGATASTRLKDWLDPDNTGITIIDGGNFNTPENQLDAAATLFSGMEDRCDTNISGVEVFFKNLGSDTLVSLDIKAYLDGDSLQFDSWTGSLSFSDRDSYILDSFSVSEGIHEIKVIVTNPNGGTDDFHLNDTITKDINAINGNIITINVNTDFYGDETGIELYDDNTNLLFQRVGFPDYASVDIDVCVPAGCYTVKVTDSYGDGISGEDIYLLNGASYFDTLSGNFTNETSTDFCICGSKIVPSINSINCPMGVNTNSISPQLDDASIDIYPNPSIGHLIVKTFLDLDHIKVIDVYGREIMKLEGETSKSVTMNVTNIDLSTQAKGVYFVHIVSEDRQVVKKIILK